MPRYDYWCEKCDKIEEHVHSMKEDPDIKCECGEPMMRLISRNFAGFNIKGGSSSIHWREKRNRIKNSETLEKRQRDRYGDGPKVAPNIAGVRQESWSDCQKLAKECGLNSDSYSPMVEKEKNKGPKIYTGR